MTPAELAAIQERHADVESGDARDMGAGHLDRGALLAEVERLRAEIALRDTCVACECKLHPPDRAPHCEDCHPTDEQVEAWNDRRFA